MDNSIYRPVAANSVGPMPARKFKWLGMVIDFPLRAAIGFLLLLSGVTLLARWHWVLDNLVSFRPHLFVLLAVLMWVALMLGRRRVGRLAGGGALLNLFFILPYLFNSSVAAPSPTANSISMLTANVLYVNSSPAAITELIERESADVVVLVEMTPQHWQSITPVAEAYPYQWHNLRHDPYGKVVLSRFPVTQRWLADEMGAAIFDLEVGETMLTLIATHTAAPLSGRAQARRNAQLQALAAFVVGENRPVLLTGDLNVVPWSPHFQSFISDSNLQDARRHHGMNATWPSGLGRAGVPLDYLLVSSQLEVTSFRTTSPIGSDHLPIVSTFRLVD